MNRKKTSVAHISKVKYLGYAFYRYKGECRFRVHPKSVTKMKDKIRELTKRSNGWGNEYRAMKLTQFVRGWVNYFSLADMKGLLRETGIIADISCCRLHLTTSNSVNLDIQHSQSLI